ncbi:major facilitator superfamily domain-containing protein [Penicillium sp. IBT 18751x]|nr:major facilitator superfamily domain-containing protein [Penicillium sp. IBT 18751x]
MTCSILSNRSTQAEPAKVLDTAPDTEKQDVYQPPTGQGPPGGPPGSQYAPKTLKFWVIMACNFLSLFIVALDRTIITTAMPKITDDFNSLGDIGWYGSAYMLTGATSQLIFGRIYKFYNMKWVFLATMVIFEVGSVVCGSAPSSNVFIAGRAIAGFASAGIFSGCMLIIIPLVPLHKRPMFQAMFGAVFGLASVLGPLIGGGFTGSVTWRWCFYINLPIGAATWIFMALVWHPVKVHHESVPLTTHIKRLDPLGTFFLVPGVVCLLLAFQWGGSTYAWNNGRIISLFVLFSILMTAFSAVQSLMPETATIPGRIITQRSILASTIFTFCGVGSMIMTIYYLPIWFQTVKLVNPVESGINTLPLVLSLVIAGFIGGGITKKSGYYVPVMILCPCILSVGLGLLSTLSLDTNSAHWIAYQILCGFGVGIGMQTGGLVVQRILPISDVPAGIALLFFVQQLGGCIFTTVGQTILSNTLVSKLADIQGIDPNLVLSEGATKLASIVAPGNIIVVQRVYNTACRRIFLASMGLTFGALISALAMEWKSIKQGKNGQDGPGVIESGGNKDRKMETSEISAQND